MASSNHAYGAQTWDEFVGQATLLQKLEIEIQAVLYKGAPEYQPFPHTLLTSPPGFGKTSLVRAIADRLGDPLTTFVMPLEQKRLDARVMSGEVGMVFFDEAHRATKKQQETLLTLMEENYYTTSGGMEVEVEGLCVVAATTREELLDQAFCDRFILKPSFDPYSTQDLEDIAELMLGRTELHFENVDLPLALAKASGGSPRGVRRLVMAAESLYRALNEEPTVERVLDHAGITEDGLNDKQIKYLQTLKRFGGRSGVSKIGSALRVNPSGLAEVERPLFDKHLIDFTDRGRSLTSEGIQRLKDL